MGWEWRCSVEGYVDSVFVGKLEREMWSNEGWRFSVLRVNVT
jgi:hypothetical protein